MRDKDKDGGFLCVQCGKMFSRRDNLTRHQRISCKHTLSSSHSTSSAPHSIGQTDQTMIGWKASNSVSGPISRCDECGRTFSRKDCLKRHQRLGVCHPTTDKNDRRPSGECDDRVEECLKRHHQSDDTAGKKRRLRTLVTDKKTVINDEMSGTGASQTSLSNTSTLPSAPPLPLSTPPPLPPLPTSPPPVQTPSPRPLPPPQTSPLPMKTPALPPTLGAAVPIPAMTGTPITVTVTRRPNPADTLVRRMPLSLLTRDSLTSNSTPSRAPVTSTMAPSDETLVRPTNAPELNEERVPVQDNTVDNLNNAPVTGDALLDECVRVNWRAIQTKVRRGGLMNLANVNLLRDDGTPLTPAERSDRIRNAMDSVWDDLPCVVKINCSFGSILAHKVNDEYRYHHASSNNASVFEMPTLIRSRLDMTEFCNRLERVDVEQMATNRRPDTSWRLKHLSNVSFYLYKLPGLAKVGAGKKRDNRPTPAYLANNRALIGVGQNFDDNLCFFRCLAVRRSCNCLGDICKHPKRFERHEHETWHLYKTFLEKTGLGLDVEGFAGVDYADLMQAETIFNVRITVYSMQPDKSSRIEWQSKCPSKGRLRLNLNVHNNHFSLITRMDRYTSTFACQHCDALFTRNSSIARHKCSVEDDVKFRFPGGAFKAPMNIFDRIKERTGLDVLDKWPHLAIYPYRVTYDIECYFPKDETLPSSSETTGYSATHHLLSVSLCSNVPEFTEPVCYVREPEVKLEPETFDECTPPLPDEWNELYNVFDDEDEVLSGPEDEDIHTDSEEEDEEEVDEDLRRDVEDDAHSGGAKQVIARMLHHIRRVAWSAYALMRERWQPALDEIERLTAEREEAEKKFARAGFSSPGAYERQAKFGGLMEQIVAYLGRIPVVGFNSQKYDMNVMKGGLLKHLVTNGGVSFVVKRCSSMTCVESSFCRFVDATNYIAPGFSYDKYLKAFGCEQTKGHFPYEWMDSLDKLHETRLPPQEAFYSSLRECGITDDEYQRCQDVWREEGMRTFRDFLVWYNNLDVVPFLEALDKQSAVFANKDIDMLKSAISLPGLATSWLFAVEGRESEQHKPVALIDNHGQELYRLIRDNLVGGPSIVFHRHHERGVTRLRESEFGEEAALCDTILGVDANALYLWCITQEMPTGNPIVRLAEDEFAVRQDLVNSSKEAFAWLNYTSQQSDTTIRHRRNWGEKKVGRHGLLVDGFDESTNTVYQFHGCYWHAHPCQRRADPHPHKNQPLADIYKDTLQKDEYIESLGYNLVRVWECQWRRLCKEDPRVASEARVYKETEFGLVDEKFTEERMIERITSGELFGLVECDIIVPDELSDKFEEMCPVFKNTRLSRDDIGEHMKEYAEKTGRLSHPQRTLVGSKRGDKILLATALLKWYLEHGLKITKIYKTFEFTPAKCFEKFGQSVSDARRAGDSDPDQALLAETSKLVGNSLYGKTITNKEKHKKIVYCVGARDASLKVRNGRFCTLEEIDEDFYEIEENKMRVVMDVPVTLGFTILQLAKLRMLQFYYDRLDRYIDRRHFQYVTMDTDSGYMALAGPLDDLVPSDKRREYYETYGQWFPRKACAKHESEFVETRCRGEPWNDGGRQCCVRVQRYDRRTPGLFKEEFSGDGVVALNSKTYYCWNEEGRDKYSSKGLSKRTNRLEREHFLSVLRTRDSVKGENRGFVKKDGKLRTYRQERAGLSYFYGKRKVHADGVSTSAPDI